MSTEQIQSLWQYIQTLSLSKRNKKWLAERLLENIQSETTGNPATIAAMKEAKDGKTLKFNNLEDFKKHMYEL